uniref:Uncharacterized protein n=1 Tax=Micrurus surinamensis TaxID=129470 RepID=A0A2D4PE81_MICSU
MHVHNQHFSFIFNSYIKALPKHAEVLKELRKNYAFSLAFLKWGTILIAFFNHSYQQQLSTCFPKRKKSDHRKASLMEKYYCVTEELLVLIYFKTLMLQSMKQTNLSPIVFRDRWPQVTLVTM